MILLCFIICCEAIQFTIQEIRDEIKEIKLHVDHHESFILANAKDVQIINNSNICEAKQRRVSFHTQSFRIIQDQDMIIFEESPFRQFLSMVHIKDGLLAITSDSIAYLLKFNYDSVYQHDFEETGHEFAKIIWKVDLKSFAPSITQKNEFPQILFAESANLGIVLYSDIAQCFSLAQIEQQFDSLDLYIIKDWKKRLFRGLTKEIDGMIFSAVGKDGLDVYKIIEKDLRFVKNLKFTDFGLNVTMEIVDFSIIKQPNAGQLEIYSIYILDKESGLILLEVHKSDTLNFGLRSWISYQKGGISVDTYNGKNVFMAAQIYNHYYVIEYIVNIKSGSSFPINSKSYQHRIIDLDATEEFVIVQGVNQHHIIMSNGYEYIRPNAKDQVFTHIGMRDFEFFKQTFITQDSKTYSSHFFFGITAQSAFLTKFELLPVEINCIETNQSNIGKTYSLIIQYNTTSEEQFELVKRHTLQLTISIVDTYLYTSAITLNTFIIIIIISIIIGGLFFTIYWFINKYLEIEEINEIIINIQNEKSQRINKKIKIDETSLMQAQNKSQTPLN